jgi:hypothetical protein
MKYPICQRRLAAVVACSIFVAQAALADGSAVIKSSDKDALKAAVGTEVTVEGKVASAEWSKSGKVCNIKFEGEPTFVVASFEKSRAKLDEAFGGDFTKQFAGATIRISGKLAEYGGRDPKYKEATQIVLSQTGQVTIMTPATQPSATSQPNTP